MKTAIDTIADNLPTYADLYRSSSRDIHRLRSDAVRIIDALRNEGYEIVWRTEKGVDAAFGKCHTIASQTTENDK